MQATAAIPLATPSDPGLAGQWHLRNPGGIDIDVLPAWTDYSGRGVRVGVVDDGFDLAHPDLAGAFRLGGWDARGNDGDPSAEGTDRHGTAVAGVIGADANGLGLVGVAHDAMLLGFRMGFGASGSIEQATSQLMRQAGVDVSNNSWGYTSPFADDFASAAFAPLRDALEHVTAAGRDGLGTVVVFAAGNARGSGDSVNHHGLQAAPQVITVAALDPAGRVASFSTPGAALLVAAPGVDILTTDRRGAAGYEPGDTVRINGTSFAAPIVSGVVALMLEANRGVGWRDVHEILALSARSTLDATWTTNGAGTWNGGGMRFSNDVGFGLVDAHAAVRLAESWDAVSTTGNLRSATAALAPWQAIPDADASGVVSMATLAGGVLIDRVQVTLDIRHSWIGDLAVSLVSPAGTESVLIARPGLVPGSVPFGLDGDDLRFTVTSNAFWGESSGGIWRLKVSDHAWADTGTLASWSITALGDAATDDTRWIFTDDFASLVAADPSRGRIADARGLDTINAAAVTGAVLLDLAAGAGTIGGGALALAAGTWIETVLGGDGDDVLIGDARDNVLAGGRGDDILDGGAGTDTARFAFARADASHAWEGDALVLSSGRFGIDRLLGIERLEFTDATVAVADLRAAVPLLPTLLLSGAGPVGTGYAVPRGADGSYLKAQHGGAGGVVDVAWGRGDAVSAVVASAWNSVKAATLRDADGGDVTLAGFVEVLAELGGAVDSAVTATGAKRGTVKTGEGDDTVTIAAFSNGADQGGWGNGFVVATGAGNDRIAVTGWNGWSYATIDAGDGHDIVTGTSGHDVIRGGTGRDWMAGGAGRDNFIFREGDGEDVIADFNAAGVDRLTFEGVAPTSVTWQTTAGNTLVRYGSAASVLLLGVVSGFDRADMIFA